MNYDVIADQISDGDSGNLVREWFSDAVGGNPAMGSGDITRSRDKLAFQTGLSNETLTIYHVPNFPTTWKDGRAAESERPTVCYRYGDAPGGRFSPPTFSPDGGKVAWSDSEGVKVVTVPAFASGCTTDGASPSGDDARPGRRASPTGAPLTSRPIARSPSPGPDPRPDPRPRPRPGPGPGPVGPAGSLRREDPALDAGAA